MPNNNNGHTYAHTHNEHCESILSVINLNRQEFGYAFFLFLQTWFHSYGAINHKEIKCLDRFVN